MAFNTSNHGGLCCGVRHIYNFPQWSEQAEQSLKNIVESANSRVGSLNRGLEVVLNDTQCIRDNSAWPKALKRLGFKIGPRFRNGVHSSYCTVFIHRAKELPPRPWQW